MNHYLNMARIWNSIRKPSLSLTRRSLRSAKAQDDYRMLDLHKKKNALPLSVERERIEREITITDEKIDEIVYVLYGVTEEERKIIEES